MVASYACHHIPPLLEHVQVPVFREQAHVSGPVHLYELDLPDDMDLPSPRATRAERICLLPVVVGTCPSARTDYRPPNSASALMISIFCRDKPSRSASLIQPSLNSRAKRARSTEYR